jgi:hypothetical protein
MRRVLNCQYRVNSHSQGLMDAMERKTEEAAVAYRRESNLAAEPTYINRPCFPM